MNTLSTIYTYNPDLLLNALKMVLPEHWLSEEQNKNSVYLFSLYTLQYNQDTLLGYIIIMRVAFVTDQTDGLGLINGRCTRSVTDLRRTHRFWEINVAKPEAGVTEFMVVGPTKHWKIQLPLEIDNKMKIVTGYPIEVKM